MQRRLGVSGGRQHDLRGRGRRQADDDRVPGRRPEVWRTEYLRHQLRALRGGTPVEARLLLACSGSATAEAALRHQVTEHFTQRLSGGGTFSLVPPGPLLPSAPRHLPKPNPTQFLVLVFLKIIQDGE